MNRVYEDLTVFYHGTRRGNHFADFCVSYANTGVGANAFEQGNVFYLTRCPATAQWFANIAQTLSLLRSWPQERLSDWPPPSAECQGDVLGFTLCKGGRLKHIDAMPRGCTEAAVALTLARLEGFDAVSFHDAGFDSVEGDPQLAELYQDGMPPITVIPLHKKALTPLGCLDYPIKALLKNDNLCSTSSLDRAHADISRTTNHLWHQPCRGETG